MKTHYFRKFGIAAVILAAALPVSFSALATRAAAQAETTTSGTDNAAQITIAPTATYYHVSGNKAKFQEDMGQRAGASAGIQSFAYGKQIDDKTRVDFEGRAIFGNEDYLLHFTIQKDDWFKVDFGYKQFFTPYDGDGGYFSLNGQSFSGSDYTNATNQLGITRSDFWVDITTLFPNLPTFTLHFDRSARYGTAGSTIWGPPSAGASVTGGRGIIPGYYYINESITTVSLDISQQLKSFSYGAGVWGQHTTTQDAVYYVSTAKTQNSAGASVGTGNNTTQDTVGAHAYVTGAINKYLTYGASGIYNQFEYDITSDSGRYTYAGTDLVYDPISRANATSASVANLLGEGTYKEWEGSANLCWRPTQNWAVVPSIDFQNYRTDMMADYTGSSLAPDAPITSMTNSSNNWFQSTEKLEIHYTGLKNWTHTLSGEFNQGTGSNSFLTTPTGGRGITNQTSYTTKIAYTANWYVAPGLSFSGQYYYKNDRNNYDTPGATRYSINAAGTKSSLNYPGFMTDQSFETNDFNIRMTWRPFTWVSNVFRYDYQRSTVSTGYQNTFPTPALIIPTAQTSKLQTHIISENLSFTPATRLFINLNGSVVFDQTALPLNVYLASATPAANGYYSGNQQVVNSDNNYFNAGFTVLYAATDIDDVSLDYNYYKTWNFVNNNTNGLPLGQNEHQYIITIGWTRHFAKPNLQFNLGYTYIGYKNASMGGNLDYHANGITGTLRYKF